MITDGAVPASRYTITGVSSRRHTAPRDFAEALGADRGKVHRLGLERPRPNHIEGDSGTVTLTTVSELIGQRTGMDVIAAHPVPWRKDRVSA